MKLCIETWLELCIETWLEKPLLPINYGHSIDRSFRNKLFA